MAEITQAGRVLVKSNLTYMYDNRAHIEYLEDRPLPVYTLAQLKAMFARGEIFKADCSWMFTQGCFMSRLLVPSGPSYPFADGLGNTTTIFDYLPHLGGFADLKLCDGIGFVNSPGRNDAHICQAYELNGDNPMVFNHGAPGEPAIRTFEEEALNHPGQEVVLLSIENLASSTPPPASSGIVHGEFTVDLSTGQWTVKHTPGSAKFEGPDKEWAAQVEVQIGAKDGGKMSIKGVPSPGETRVTQGR